MNSIARAVLNEYISKNNLTLSDIAKATSLSLNTVKSFVNGNKISTASYAKLLRLGEEYNQWLEKVFGDLMISKTKKTIYCYSCGKCSKGCWATQMLWNTEKKELEHYCAFGFEQFFDENQKLFAVQECPHPTTGKEFAKAREQYELFLKCALNTFMQREKWCNIMKANVYKFLIGYKGYEEKIWREVEVSGNYALSKLAYLVLVSFDTHANYLFFIEYNGNHYEIDLYG